MIVEVSERLEQRLAGSLDGRCQLHIDRNLARYAVFGDVCVARGEIDVPAKRFRFADGQMFCDDALAVRRDERF
jgi:hypothetical protein